MTNSYTPAPRERALVRNARALRLAACTLLSMVLLGSFGVGAGVLSAAPAHANGTEDGVVVEIVDPTPTPAPAPPPATPSAGPSPQTPTPRAATNSTPAPPAPSVTQQSITDPTAADTALGDQSESMAGLFYVSAAHTTPSLTIHPNGGEVKIVLSIRNVAGETIDGAARFWINTAWGWQMSEVVEEQVLALAPGETRELTATLPGPGQWTFYQAHAEFLPPATVDGVDLKPIVRAENTMVFPLFSVGIAAIAGLGVGGYFWWARSRFEVLPE